MELKNIFLKYILFMCFFVLSGIFFVKNSHAVEDPLSKQNNIFGIHILFHEEVKNAADLVNSSGGDWGYVTIPIQAGDKDLYKWQDFLNKTKELHVIPIIRLSTEEYYFQKGVWRKPDFTDVVDFANFLNSLSWPTKNRYVILFNEVNRFDEWGGEAPDPSYYAQVVSFSYETFKKRDSDFFIILGGFDNASVNVKGKYMNGFDFLKRMYEFDNDIFNKIDGFSSHSYPNPGFMQPPDAVKRMGTATYKHEYNYINSLAKSKKYAFITETGWDKNVLSEEIVANYYRIAFTNIWGADKDKIVAVTPFLLQGGDQFGKFTFYKGNDSTKYSDAFKQISKVKGDPVLNPSHIVPGQDFIPEIKKFNKQDSGRVITSIPSVVKIYLKTILGL